MGRRVLRRHIWGYIVCLCLKKGTPGLNELKVTKIDALQNENDIFPRVGEIRVCWHYIALQFELRIKHVFMKCNFRSGKHAITVSTY